MRLLVLTILIFLSSCLFAQNEIGLKFQIYPAGYINTAQFILDSGETSAWTFEAGYNTTNRQDFGKHDNEKGGGFGLGAGYRQYFKESMKGFYAEANLETWFLDIDWRDVLPTDGVVFGETKITVLQPTLGLGYQFRSKSEKWTATIGATFGREWNVKTKGEELGQGGISLLSFSVLRRL